MFRWSPGSGFFFCREKLGSLLGADSSGVVLVLTACVQHVASQRGPGFGVGGAYPCGEGDSCRAG